MKGILAKTFKIAVLLILIIGFSVALEVDAAGPSLSNSGGGSWTDSYTFVINSSSVGLTDYQFRVDLSTAVQGSPYLNFENDGRDIRFTNSAGAELPYWIESWNSFGDSVIWVKIDSIAVVPSITEINVYYGNSNATSSSNAQNTFEFFDDFTGTSYNTAVWTTDVRGGASISSATVASSILSFKTGQANSGSAVIKTATISFSPNHAIRAREKNIGSESWYPGGFGFGFYYPFSTTSGVLKGIGTQDKYAFTSIKNGLVAPTSAIVVDDLWYTFDLLWSNSKTGLRRDDIVLGTNTNINAIPTINLPITIGNSGDYGNSPLTSSATNVDWIAVRKYVNPEPTIAAPRCDFAATPLVFTGMDSNLTWTTEYAVDVTINGNPENLNGSKIDIGTANTPYTLIATNSIGITTTCNASTIVDYCEKALVPCGRICNAPETAWDDTEPCEVCHGILLMNQGMNFLTQLAGIISVLALIVVGFLYITSTGNPERKNLAKSSFKWILIGFTLIFLSWLIVDFLLSAWGYLDPMGGKWNVICG